MLYPQSKMFVISESVTWLILSTLSAYEYDTQCVIKRRRVAINYVHTNKIIFVINEFATAHCLL